MLDKAAVSYNVVLTKADKIKASALAATLDAVRLEAAKHPASHPTLFATSSETGMGIAELRTAILEAATDMKLIIGNRAYSSWSFRGWLACKQSGEAFEELVVPMFDENWEKRREGDEFAPSLGKVPVLWDGDCVVWDSLAIIEFLADRVGRDKFWPADPAARGMARSMAAEMHSGFANLRRELPMNVRKSFGSVPLSSDVEAEVVRILNLWAQARARFGGSGEYLFGDWCAADIMFAPVVTRFVTYGVKVPPFAAIYMEAVLHRADVVEWIELAQDEPWVIEQYEEKAPGA